MIKKNDYGSYEAPEAIEFWVRNESAFCTSPNGSWDNSIKQGTTWGDNDDDDYGLE